MAKMPKIAATNSAPRMPPANPASTLCVACCASTAVIAAVSIIPSMPRLMMPARCTTISPSTASSSGVEAMIAIGSACRMTSITCAPAPEKNEDEDHDRFAEDRHVRGDAGRSLQLARAGGERAEEDRRRDRRQRMQLRQQRDGDAGVAVAGGEALEQPMRDAEQLDAAGQSGQRAADAHRADE